MIVVLVLILAVGGFLWRVSNRPYDISFAKSYIQDALYDSETGNHARMDKVVLFWPELTGPLYIKMKGSKILNRGNDVILSVNEVALSFSGYGLLQGRLLPTAIILDAPLLRVTRQADNRFDFGFAESEADAPIDATHGQEQESMVTRILGYVARPGAEDANGSVISHLEALEIRKARLVVSDHVLGLSWYVPDFSAAFESTDMGMQARFDLNLPKGEDQMSGINLELRYFWEDKTADMTLDIEDLDLMVLAGKMPELQVFKDMHKTVNARIEGHLGQDFAPENLSGYVDLDGIKINGDVDFITDAQKQTKASAKITIDEVAQSRMDEIWPQPVRGENAEIWIVERMADGIFKDVWAQADFDILRDGDGAISFKAGNVTAGFAFENMSVDYRHPLPAATKLYGNGGFDLQTDELKITIDRGFLGAMAVKKAYLLFDRLIAVGEGDANLDIDLHGDIRNVLDYISIEPISLGDKLDFDVKAVKGTADLNVKLVFPTQGDVKVSDFKVGIEGELNDVFVPDLVVGMDVSGGPMKINVKDGKIGIEGKGKVDGRDMDFGWSEFLEHKDKPYLSKVKAKLIADPKLRAQMGIILDDFIAGDVGVDLDYTSFADGKAKVLVDADLTPSVFFVAPFDYLKPAGEAASATLTAHLMKREIKNITDLTAKGKDFTLDKSSLEFKKIKDEVQLWSGKFSSFTLGETKGKLEFQFDNAGKASIVMDAPFLDAQPFLAGKNSSARAAQQGEQQPQSNEKGEENKTEGEKQPYNEPPMVISVTAKTMRTAPNETVRDAKMFIDIDGQGRFNQMEMDATAGASQIYLRYKPDKDGKRVFNLQTDDAGAALKAFQVYNNIRGGKMVIYGEPVRGILDRNLVGLAEITDFRVVDAPALTNLLRLMSLSGIAEIMAGEGLHFARLEADFSWVYRRDGSLLVLKNGRTSGNSVGLTFDGTFDNEKRIVDVGGTIVPMSAINNIIGDIPLIGDILTGGSGVFAATYTVKGTSEKTDVSVNPLSVLTPGIIRRILFE